MDKGQAIGADARLSEVRRAVSLTVARSAALALARCPSLILRPFLAASSRFRLPDAQALHPIARASLHVLRRTRRRLASAPRSCLPAAVEHEADCACAQSRTELGACVGLVQRERERLRVGVRVRPPLDHELDLALGALEHRCRGRVPHRALAVDRDEHVAHLQQPRRRRDAYASDASVFGQRVRGQNTAAARHRARVAEHPPVLCKRSGGKAALNAAATHSTARTGSTGRGHGREEARVQAHSPSKARVLEEIALQCQDANPKVQGGDSARALARVRSLAHARVSVSTNVQSRRGAVAEGAARLPVDEALVAQPLERVTECGATRAAAEQLLCASQPRLPTTIDDARL
eukprot:1086718-Pleurochrysis_carterae.AAC.4